MLRNHLWGIEKLYQSCHQILQGNLVIVRNGRGVSVLQGPILVAVSVKYRSVGRMTASYLISSDLTLKVELI